MLLVCVVPLLITGASSFAHEHVISCARMVNTVIESITSHREPQPEFEAMYLLMPTNQNVDRIIRDFSGPTKQYAASHLFFIEGEGLLPIEYSILISHLHVRNIVIVV
jgi:hypothetical protein